MQTSKCRKARCAGVDVDLTVNGEKVDLNDFVRGFIWRTVTGMVKSLKGVGSVETVDLMIMKKAKRSPAHRKTRL